MKSLLRFIRKTLILISALFLTAFLFMVVFFSIKGYTMYQNAVRETPITEIVDTVRSQENFTTYDELPSIYIDAVISAEDRRFESHFGIDLVAISRAAWTNIKTHSFKEGGSTITQQIAKNLLFTQEKRFDRKFAEVFAAFALEKEYSKEELFELYVNTIYFGSGYYGIYDAAQGYFGKLPSELTDYEAVMLAGIPNAPSIYSLDNHIDLAKKRLSVVLERMISCGKITDEEARAILKEADKQK